MSDRHCPECGDILTARTTLDGRPSYCDTCDREIAADEIAAAALALRARFVRQAVHLEAPRVLEDERRDYLAEAGAIVRGGSLFLPERAHLRELVDVLGGALRAYVERAERIGLQPGTFTRAEIAEVEHARAVLARLDGAPRAMHCGLCGPDVACPGHPGLEAFLRGKS